MSRKGSARAGVASASVERSATTSSRIADDFAQSSSSLTHLASSIGGSGIRHARERHRRPYLSAARIEYPIS